MTISVATSNPIFIDGTKQEVQNKAAIVIQSAWRGYIVRKHAKEDFLCPKLFKKGLEYINVDVNHVLDLPEINGGSLTAYFLPEDIPVVVKKFKTHGLENNITRYKKMMEAHRICRLLGTRHLVVPPARLYGKFLVEEKLPVDIELLAQMELYIENRARFTLPVLEFLKFLFVTNLRDIVGFDWSRIYDCLDRTPVGLYRNFPAYIENDQIRIGLIDLGECDDTSSYTSLSELYAGHFSSYYIFRKCIDVLYLFPYHFDEIIQEAKKWCSLTECNYSYLEKARDESLKRFKLAYVDHVAFFERKGITYNNPAQFETLREETTNKIKEDVIKKFQERLNGYKYLPGRLTLIQELHSQYGASLMTSTEIALPIITRAIVVHIQSCLKENLAKYGKQPTCNHHLIELRYAYLDRNIILKNTLEALPSITTESDTLIEVVGKIFLEAYGYILQELQNCGEIYFFNGDAPLYC